MKQALNIGCGRNIIQSTEEIHWTNVDSYEREAKLDVICDVTEQFPFEKDHYDYVYAEQFLEHLSWLDGLRFLRNCYDVLKAGGKLRLVIPHYRKIFQKYLEGDLEFFKVFFRGLNDGDFTYYSRVYFAPEIIKKERKENPPPAWHVSKRKEDRARLELRLRQYRFPIEIVDWFCHQYFEHKTVWDFEALKGHLKDLKFTAVYETEIKEIDSDAPTRITSSLYVEAVK